MNNFRKMIWEEGLFIQWFAHVNLIIDCGDKACLRVRSENALTINE